MMLKLSLVPQQGRSESSFSQRYLSRYRVLCLSGCLLSGLWLGSVPAHATITVTGDVTPAYNGTDDPWDIRPASEYDPMYGLDVGNASVGSMSIDGGSVVRSAGGVVGNGSDGTVTISGANSIWNALYTNNTFWTSATVKVGLDAPGIINVINGAALICNSGLIYDDGVVNISGTGSRWEMLYDIAMVELGVTGSLQILQGGTVSVPLLSYITSSGGDTGVRVNGNGSTYYAGYTAEFAGTGTSLIIENGGYAEAYDVKCDSSSSVGPHIVITGADSALATYGNLTVADTWMCEFEVSGGGLVTSEFLVIGSKATAEGVLNLSGAESRLSVNSSLTIGESGQGTLNINENASVELSTYASVVLGKNSSAQGVINMSSGTLNLRNRSLSVGSGTGVFNFTGGTLLNAGTIDLKQDFAQDGGTLAPGGSIGQTDIVGGYDLNAGTVEIELGGAGSPHDLITVTGDIDIATVGTTLDLSALGPIDAGTYTVIESTGGALTGTFEQVTGIGYYPGLVNVTYTANAVMVTLTGDFLPGDLNGDGFVGLDDLDIVLNNWNTNVPPSDPAADPSGDGYVGLDDLDIVLTNWNSGTPPGMATDIPEPAGIALIGATALLLRRRSAAA